jgi:hypothetical protein
MIPKHIYDKPFTIRFPDRSEWKEGVQPDRKNPNNLPNKIKELKEGKGGQSYM